MLNELRIEILLFYTYGKEARWYVYIYITYALVSVCPRGGLNNTSRYDCRDDKVFDYRSTILSTIPGKEIV